MKDIFHLCFSVFLSVADRCVVVVSSGYACVSVWRASLLIWHIVCSLWFTAQPYNVRQEQAPATEGENEKTWSINDFGF